MNNCITELLQIKDKNIILDPTFKKEKIKGQTHFIFKGVLSYKPTKCECCNSNKVVKNGFNEPTTINLLKLSGIPSRLTLKKQRFKCKQCNKKFVARTSLVLKYCHISQNVKLSILKALTATLSFKQISKEHNVSENTTIRVLKSCRKQVEVNCYKSLPQHLCFDEIKSTKDSKHSMSFVFLNAKTHDFIDIVEGRTKYILNNYFLRFKRKTKNKVKTICIDIYPPYMDIIKKHFPNARIIIDRFHIIQNINRELNKERMILIMVNKHNSLSHTKWLCKYHIVFTPKYRRKIEFNQYKRDIVNIIQRLCKYKGIEIIEGHIMPDHIHLLLSIPPKYSVSSIMGYLKGKSSLMIFDMHSNLKYKYGNRKFWAEGYYVSTVGLNESTIRKYIREQESHDIAMDKLTTKEYINPFGNKKK